jgi:hypothetical protein
MNQADKGLPEGQSMTRSMDIPRESHFQRKSEQGHSHEPLNARHENYRFRSPRSLIAQPQARL